MASAIAAALSMPRGIARDTALNNIQPYRSRGKGTGGTWNSSNPAGGTTYFPPEKRNSGRERSRRMRQIQRGIIRVSA